MYSRKTFKGMVVLLCAVLFAFMLLGCNSTEQTGETTTTVAPTTAAPTTAATTPEATPVIPDEPTKISMLNIYWNPEPPNDDGVIMKTLEEMCNVELDMTWVPASVFSDKVTATIASGDMPEVMLILDNYSNTIKNAVTAGVFWEVGPYIDDYANLSQLPKFVFNNIKIDGKIYGIFRSRDSIREGIVYRKDWLDNLGLSEPKTLDDLYNVIKAFALDDPDGDGQQNTYGLGQRKNDGGLLFTRVAIWMGCPNEWGWVEEESIMRPVFMYDEYLDALNWAKRLYDEKLMNQDFAVTEISQWKDSMIKGKSGMIFAVIDSVEEMGDLYNLNPNAELDVIHAVDAGKGMRLLTSQGYGGVFMFPKSSVKDEAQLRGILAFIDRTCDKELEDFLDWGIEGTHYTMENGIPSRTEDQMKLYNDEVNPFGQFRVDFSKGMKGNELPLILKYKQMLVDDLKYGIGSAGSGLDSETRDLKWDDLNQNILDAETKYVMGVIDEAGWNEVIEQWRQNGGDKIIEELTADYIKKNK